MLTWIPSGASEVLGILTGDPSRASGVLGSKWILSRDSKVLENPK